MPTEADMENERRDYSRRADCLCRLVRRLLTARRGLSDNDLADDYLSFAGAQRILSRLVFKGFVRRNRNGWVATRLLTGCPLVPINGRP
jgi:hypothetical protein